MLERHFSATILLSPPFTGHTAFSEEIAKYEQGNHSIKCPLNEFISLDLMTSITYLRKNK
jgi:hypothetical protein